MIEQQQKTAMAIAILNHNEGSHFIKDAIKEGLKGGFATSAKGLIQSALLNLLSIRHDKRDCVILFEKKDVLLAALTKLSQKWQMHLPNHGVIFVFDTQFALRNDNAIVNNNWNSNVTPYQLVFMSFKHGKVFDVLQHINIIADEKATIFTGRGEHVQEKQQLLGMSFSPQKDAVLSVVQSQHIHNVFEVMENHYHCSQTKGMYVYSLNVLAYSNDARLDAINTAKDEQLCLLSVVDEALEETYVNVMKKHQLHGGTSVKAHGFVTVQMKEAVLNQQYPPQQKLLLTVDTAERIQLAYEALKNDATMQQNNSTFMCIPVLQTYGLYKQ